MHHVSKEDGDDMKVEQADIDSYSYEEEMEEIRLNEKRKFHWRKIFEDNGRRVVK